jgi:hypothetical protein
MSNGGIENQAGAATAKTALVVAHPGHELRIHHWLELNQPLYFCLTDGSGRSGSPRLDSTKALLGQVGATTGSFCGLVSDQEFYRILLEGRRELFTSLLEELVGALIDQNISVVAGDAPEGATPTHDLCRYLIDAAVAIVERTTDRHINNYEFVLDSAPDDCPEHLRAVALWLHLDEAALERKLAAAASYQELREEAQEALRIYGRKAFALECLRPSTGAASLRKFRHESPAYERYGREGVEWAGKQFGRYEKVITFREHVWPMVQVIHEAAQESTPLN